MENDKEHIGASANDPESLINSSGNDTEGSKQPESENEKEGEEAENTSEAESMAEEEVMDQEPAEEEKEETGAKVKKEFKTTILGKQPTVLEEPDIEEMHVANAGRDIVNNYINSSIKTPKGQKFPCPKCGKEIEIKKYGRQFCDNDKCKQTFIITNSDVDKNIIMYRTLLPDEAKQYDKILAHISNNLQDNKYDIALQYCKQAEELAPGEVATWVYFALAEFLVEIRKSAVNRDPSVKIIRKVRSHIEKCKIHGMTDEECRPLEKDIADRLFKIESARIKSVQPQFRDYANHPKWSRFNLDYLERLLESFEVCYQLYDDISFLEGYADELKKEYKWIVRTTNGELVNMPACGSFDAVKKLNTLVSRIKTKKPEYEFPVLAEERYEIKKRQYLKINSVIAKPG
ncbi:MAG: hypothetical protein U0U70_01730 [Chitinophagaceae bacterium]